MNKDTIHLNYVKYEHIHLFIHLFNIHSLHISTHITEQL